MPSLTLTLAAVVLASLTPSAALGEEPDVGLAAFRRERRAALTKPDGWLSLVGLLWLAEGDNRVGAAADSELRLPAGWPERLGVFKRRDRAVQFFPVDGVAVALGDQQFAGGTIDLRGGDSAPLILDPQRGGQRRLAVIVRGDKVGLRLRDSQAATLTHFAGLAAYPENPAARVLGHFSPAAPGSTVAIANVLGQTADEPLPGTVAFTYLGQPQTLSPTGDDDGRLFFVFGDATNGDTTYGAGRFLSADPPAASGEVWLDFNRAINPPCAFTPYATCPLPPRGNRLAVRVEAGERRPADH